MLVNTFLASLAAKLAMATGLAVATVSAAGAAGVLPDPAQNAVASVVEATTPFTISDASKTVDDVVGGLDEVVGDVTTTTLDTSTGLPGIGEDEGDTDEVTDDTRKVNHGACVSTVAKNTPGGPEKGKTVSSVARSDCGKTTSTTVAPTSSTSSTSTTVAGLTSSDSESGSANRGKGNSGKSANSGKGNSGKN